MDPENNPGSTDPTVVEGGANVEGTALNLDQLNEKLGTNYKTIDAALAGLKETRNYVGKAGVVEKENAELKKQLEGGSGNYLTKDQYEQDMFYARNADLEPYKDIINARAKELSLRPAEAIEKDASLKGTLEKLRAADKQESSKSVLMSNSRLGQVTDDMAKAQEAAGKGDYRSASDSAVKAVMAGIK